MLASTKPLSAAAVILAVLWGAGCTGEVTQGMPERANSTTGGSSASGGAPPVVAPSDCAASPPPRAPLRRLTRLEYNNTVRDLLGDTSNPGNAFPSELLGNGFGNDADSQPVGSELSTQYMEVSETIAANATAPERIGELAPCAAQIGPTTDATSEVACVQTIVDTLVPKAFRRVLAAGEAESFVALFQSVRESSDFRTSLATLLEAILQSPEFKIRDIEVGLEKTVEGGGACQPPVLIDTSNYDYAAGRNMTSGADTVQESAIETDKMIPAVGKLMMDMMVMALACDITAVGSFQWSDTEAKHTFPWLGLSEHHHFYQHDGGFQAAQCEQIGIWYSQMHAYLLDAMDKVDMGGHTLLDESVVIFGSELAHPPEHTNVSIPLMLAGAGGGLKGGRHLKYGGRPHNDLLVAVLNLFGDERTSYAHPEFNTGPISDLKG